jgi:hypothetical protein
MKLLLPIACATCRPDPGSLMAQAQDAAVLVMLGFLMISFGAVGLTLVHFFRKQSQLSSDSSL